MLRQLHLHSPDLFLSFSLSPHLFPLPRRCLAGGFGGFAVDRATGAAHFRSAGPAALAAALRPSPGTDFYILTVALGRLVGAPGGANGATKTGAGDGGTGSWAASAVSATDLWECPPQTNSFSDGLG